MDRSKKKLLERISNNDPDEELKDVLRARKFCFSDELRGCVIPKRFENSEEAIAEFGFLEIKLNSIRHFLNDIDIQTWGSITDSSDISSKFRGTVLNFLYRQIEQYCEKYQEEHGVLPKPQDVMQYCSEPEMLTRAWIKFHEILGKFRILEVLESTFNLDFESLESDNLRSVRVLFLCEAPGGFVSAFNNQIKGRPFRWVATSLNPYHEACGKHNSTILDDRMVNDTFSNWYFGPDNTGNIGHENYSEGLRNFVRGRWADMAFLPNSEIKFHFVTADGGLDCVDRPDLQEHLSFNLILREIYVAFNFLADNGILVVKFFNTFKRCTIYLMHLLYETFDNISSFKPISSKGGNSEVYLVCIGFRRPATSEQALNRFNEKLSRYRSLNSSEFPVEWDEIPDTFIYLAYESSYFFTKKQITVIRHNVILFECALHDVKTKSKSRLKTGVARRFLSHYPVNMVGESKSLGSKHAREMNLIGPSRALMNADEKTAQNFYGQMKRAIRFQALRSFVSERRGSLRFRLMIGVSEYEPQFMFQMFTGMIPNLEWLQKCFFKVFILKRPDLNFAQFANQHLKPTFGRPYEVIKNTRFCDASLLQARNILMDKELIKNDLSSFDEKWLEPPRMDGDLRDVIQKSINQFLIESKFCEELKTNNRMWFICYMPTFSDSNKKKQMPYKSIAACLQEALSEQMQVFLPIVNDFPKVRRSNETHIFMFESDPNLHERVLFERLLTFVDQLLIHLEREDLLIIRVELLFSRCLVQLLYLLIMFLFNRYSIIPLVLQSTTTPDDSSNPSFLSNWLVLKINEKNMSERRFAQRIVLVKKIIYTLRMKIKDSVNKDRTLVELFPFALISHDKLFIELLSNANMTYLIETMKIVLSGYLQSSS